MRWTSAISTRRSLSDAVQEAAARIAEQMDGQDIDAVFVFATPHHAAAMGDLPRLLRGAIHFRHLAGCSAGGVIGDAREVEEGPALSLTAASLPGVEITPFHLEASDLPDADASPRAWASLIGLPAFPRPQFVILSDAFSFPTPLLLDGLDYAYEESVTVGGLASGGMRAGANKLFLDDAVHDRGAVGLALTGDIEIETIVAQGCRPIGEPMRITSGQGNILMELERRPALEAIQDLLPLLSERDRTLATETLSLGVVMDRVLEAPRPGDFLIRNIVGADSDSGALAVGELVRDGQLVQFHVRDALASHEDLEHLLRMFAAGRSALGARGALLFSCLERGVRLYGQPGHDSSLFRDLLGDLPLGGFFCSGEIGPVAGSTRLHGFTSAFAIFGPRQD